MVLLITWYSLWSLQGRIKCQFHRKDRTVIEKTIKVKDKQVWFDNGCYQINPKRFSIKWFKLWSVFPYPMLFQEWKWDTDQPIDPSTFKNSWDSPEARNAADSEKDWRNMNGGLDAQSGAIKQTGLMKWLPFITIGVLVIGLVFLYSTFNGKLGVIEEQLQNLGGLIKTVK
jgi:hypothetical protein